MVSLLRSGVQQLRCRRCVRHAPWLPGGLGRGAGGGARHVLRARLLVQVHIWHIYTVCIDISRYLYYLHLAAFPTTSWTPVWGRPSTPASPASRLTGSRTPARATGSAWACSPTSTATRWWSRRGATSARVSASTTSGARCSLSASQSPRYLSSPPTVTSGTAGTQPPSARFRRDATSKFSTIKSSRPSCRRYIDIYHLRTYLQYPQYLYLQLTIFICCSRSITGSRRCTPSPGCAPSACHSSR